MLYTELIGLWNEAAMAVDARDWQGALSKVDQITEPNSRTFFIAAAAYLALGHLEPAIQALDQVISRDGRLAVGFFQRSGVLMQVDRLEEALSDCISAQTHMRGNVVIDYRQLGLRYKLYSWQVLYNAAAVYCRMGHWDQARDILGTATQERGGGQGRNVELALDSLARGEVLAPLLVPEGEVFRPKKQEVEQLQQKDFLGKAKVIQSQIPNDDFGGFEPLREQKPGFYEPKVEGADESRYMRVRVPYMARNPRQLTVPGGAIVFVLSDVDREGMATVISDGRRGLLPLTLLDPVKAKKKREGVPTGIPHPPGLKPPARPRSRSTPAAPPHETPPPSYTTVTSPFLTVAAPVRRASSGDTTARQLSPTPVQAASSVVVKVHYSFTVALSVPLDTPYPELQERIAQKLGQPAAHLRLRHRQHGSHVLKPLDEEGELRTLGEVAETGRATLWCQTEHPLANRVILYQMVALYDYAGEGPEDLDFSEGDTIDILGEVNEEWLEGHCAGKIGIFPICFAYREEQPITESPVL